MRATCNARDKLTRHGQNGQELALGRMKCPLDCCWVSFLYLVAANFLCDGFVCYRMTIVFGALRIEVRMFWA